MPLPILDLSAIKRVVADMITAPSYDTGLHIFTEEMGELYWPVDLLMENAYRETDGEVDQVYLYLKEILINTLDTKQLPSMVNNEDAVIITIDE